MTPEIIDTIAVGNSPIAMAVNVRENEVYVANWGSNSITIIDANTNEVKDTVELDAAPVQIVVNEYSGRLYATHASSISVADLDTKAVQVINLAGVEQLAVDTAENMLYAISRGTLYSISGFTNAVSAADFDDDDITLVAVDPDKRRLYLNHQFEDVKFSGEREVVSVVDVPTWKVVERMETDFSYVSGGQVSEKIDPNSLAIVNDPANGRLYVANDDADVEVFNTSGNILVGVVNEACYGKWCMINELEVDSALNRIYALWEHRILTVIDGTNLSFVDDIQFEDSSSIALNPENGFIYVAHQGSASVSVIDGRAIKSTEYASTVQDRAWENDSGYSLETENGPKVSTVVLEGRLHKLAVGTESNLLYVTADQDLLHIIDLRSNALAKTVELPDQVLYKPGCCYRNHDIELNSGGDRLYLSVYSTDMQLVLDAASGVVVDTQTIDDEAKVDEWLLEGEVGVYRTDVVAIDEERDLGFAARDDTNRILIFDVESKKIFSSFLIPGEAVKLMVDPDTGSLYAIRLFSSAVSIVDGPDILSFVTQSQVEDEGKTTPTTGSQTAGSGGQQPSGVTSSTGSSGEGSNTSPSGSSQGGGCLIATAAYGSEFAPQVQMLREIRDGQLLKTTSGSAFMSAFNSFYYSWSPTVAEWERQNPAFKEAVRIAITPLITTLSILPNVSMDSEAEALGYGIGVIALNIGIYFVAPAFAIMFIRSRKKSNQ